MTTSLTYMTGQTFSVGEILPTFTFEPWSCEWHIHRCLFLVAVRYKAELVLCLLYCVSYLLNVWYL